MRVAVVVSTYPPYPGGMGNVAYAHAEALRRAGHDVTVLAPGIGLRPLYRIGNAAVVPQLLWRLIGFDVIELHVPFFGGAEWVWLWKRLFGRGTRLVIMYHMDTVGRGPAAAVFATHRNLFLEPLLKAADRIIVTSRDYLVSSLASYLTEDPRIREVPLWVEAERFTPDPSKRDVKTAIFVGGLDSAHYFKGVDILLEAFSKTLASVPDARLVIVGDGDLRGTYERRAKELGLAGNVRFAGKAPDAELRDLYIRSLFHVLPSVDRSEAFGLVTLEAAASGIPSVVSDLPGVRAVVEQGKTGLIVPPGDASALSEAMTGLFLDPDRAAGMGAAARERVLARYARRQVETLLVEAVLR